MTRLETSASRKAATDLLSTAGYGTCFGAVE